ncbi:unnamed protein product [Nippostrongylus brasiliensis]|uniref:BTB domain-containing protein n=1 Tax=Nippostrongylus brasiliensis TaxID=27835 RepID=A0A0N4YAX6_NIPBR|nr:unnamed protein product [Nippostrongylus brasiliensis]
MFRSTHRLSLHFVLLLRETLSTGGFVESKEIRVVVKDIDGETLRVLVDYLYTGRLDIKEKNVKALFGVAKNLHLDSVLNECTSCTAAPAAKIFRHGNGR